MSYETMRVRRQLLLGLSKCGAGASQITRVPRDPNGVVTGQAAYVGAMYGVAYAKYAQSGLHIDLPGITLGDDGLRYVGVLTGGDPPQAEDLLTTGGKNYKILRASDCLGVAWDLRLSEVDFLEEKANPAYGLDGLAPSEAARLEGG